MIFRWESFILDAKNVLGYYFKNFNVLRFYLTRFILEVLSF